MLYDENETFEGSRSVDVSVIETVFKDVVIFCIDFFWLSKPSSFYDESFALAAQLVGSCHEQPHGSSID